MKRFITQYKIKRKKFLSAIEASDWNNAEKVCERRSIGEIVVGETEKEFRVPQTVMDLLHWSQHLGYILLKGNILTPEEILGDFGVTHQLVHLLSLEQALSDEDETMLIRQLTSMFRLTHTWDDKEGTIAYIIKHHNAYKRNYPTKAKDAKDRRMFFLQRERKL